VKSIGRNVTGVQGDASKLSDLDALYAKVKAEKGHIDVLFASAGTGDFNVPIGSVTEEIFDKTFNLNVRGTLFTVQKALPLFRDGGSIIMNGSIVSIKGISGMGVYNASKAAVRSFARTWTNDLKDRKIRVNVLSPGTIQTGIFDGIPQEVIDGFKALIPMGRVGQPRDCHRRAVPGLRRFQLRHRHRTLRRRRHRASLAWVSRPGCHPPTAHRDTGDHPRRSSHKPGEPACGIGTYCLCF